MDDEYIMVNNKQVQGGIKNIPEIFRTTYSLDNKSSFEYRPLVKATFALEYEFFGVNPQVSHFINIVLYILAVSLLFYLLLKLLPDKHYVFSLIVTLLFLAHPVHSEVVMSLKNRDGILSFIGCVSSLLFYLRFAEGKSLINLLWGLVFMLMALVSKKDSFTYFAVIPFAIWFFRDPGKKKLLLIIVSYLPAFLIFKLAAKSVINNSSRTMLFWENPLFIDSTFLDRIPQGLYSIYFYLKIFILPHPLISYYGYDQVPIVGWNNIIVWLMITLLSVLLYFIIKNIGSKPLWIFAIVYFLITISMFTNVVQPVVGIVGERFAFIPSVGLCILLALALFRLFKVPFGKIELRLTSVTSNFWIVTVVILLIYSGKTFSRNGAWKDAITLYRTDADHATESAHTHSLLASAAVSKAKSDIKISRQEKLELINLAVKHYKEAIKILPDYISVHNNLGMIYYAYLGKPESAIIHLNKAIELDPDYQEACFNLAACYASIKDYYNAEKFYLRAIKIDPSNGRTYVALSKMYAEQKQFDKIIQINQEAIDKGVGEDAPFINIGNVYFMNNDTLKALPYLEKAIEKNPNNNPVNMFLSNYYRSKGNDARSRHYSKFITNGK